MDINNCLQGKTAVVTGARRGIGRAIALALAEAGADVAVCDIVADDGLLTEQESELEKLGSKSITLIADVSLARRRRENGRRGAEGLRKDRCACDTAPESGFPVRI